MDLGLALIVGFLMASMTAVRSQIQKGPANALKKTGDSVTIECVTVNKNCHHVDWQKVEVLQSPQVVYRNGTGMVNSDLYPPQRYSVNSTGGGCSLTIRQLEIGDSGRFMCKQALGAGEETRSSILVVINVAESCMSNVTSNALDKDDGYSLRCAITIPAKSVEPSNVTLSFHNKSVGERETVDKKQPLTVNTTLTGTAKKENITRVCRASFPHSAEDNYDSTTGTLDVCTTQWIVSYPVENIAVSTPGPYYKDDTVRCAADGHPPPTFKWTHLKSGDAVDGDTLMIKGDAGHKYTCTATNTVKGREASKSITIEVSSRRPSPRPSIGRPPTCKCAHSKSGAAVDGNARDEYTYKGCGSGCIAGIVIGIIIIVVIVVVVYLAGWKRGLWDLSPCCLLLCNRWENCNCGKNGMCWKNCNCWKICIRVSNGRNGENDPTSSGPAKPPSWSDIPIPQDV